MASGPRFPSSRRIPEYADPAARGGRPTRRRFETREAALRVWRFPDQVVRLAILFLVAIAALIVVRHLLVPDTFGELGHYRAAAIPANADLPIRYAGWQACADCHDDQVQAKSASFHRTISCEVCHGPANDHVQDPEAHKPAVPRGRGEACLYCHEYLTGRPTGFPQIIEATHNPRQTCIGCHNPHDPAPPETPGSCAGCHALIARTKAVSRHDTLECTTCHEAPREHRDNPRAHLPKKPTARAFCGTCHAKDASSAREIPRVDMATHGGTYLCWQCHYPHDPES